MARERKPPCSRPDMPSGRPRRLTEDERRVERQRGPPTPCRQLRMLLQDLRDSAKANVACFPDHLSHQKQRAADCAAALSTVSRQQLFQIGHRGQVSREFDDAGRAAPVRTCTARIDRRDIGRSGNMRSMISPAAPACPVARGSAFAILFALTLKRVGKFTERDTSQKIRR